MRLLYLIDFYFVSEHRRHLPKLEGAPGRILPGHGQIVVKVYRPRADFSRLLFCSVFVCSVIVFCVILY